MTSAYIISLSLNSWEPKASGDESAAPWQIGPRGLDSRTFSCPCLGRWTSPPSPAQPHSKSCQMRRWHIPASSPRMDEWSRAQAWSCGGRNWKETIRGHSAHHPMRTYLTGSCGLRQTWGSFQAGWLLSVTFSKMLFTLAVEFFGTALNLCLRIYKKAPLLGG
ncbi:uncharacterized protein LOC121499615 isoform X2 [Vulpes lagopus]|uniref:uncharacterized protein LOC121499615 isoform X2 n=1 Tax=Vulpes lagopus TaxID=494514 RepID=UPI001BC95B18|nr:uncharacterized protein LOC121499615 isoform X2 [Vulpes lagopus]